MENLSEDDIQYCQRAFQELDENMQGEIKAEDLNLALELVGYKQRSHKVNKMISEIDEFNTGIIKFKDFLLLFSKLKYAGMQDDDQDMIDAFVAMGGEEDTSGHVDAKKLIQIIKMEFGLTIDIEGLIREVDTDLSGEIEFGEFKDLLKTNYLVDNDDLQF